MLAATQRCANRASGGAAGFIEALAVGARLGCVMHGKVHSAYIVCAQNQSDAGCKSRR